MSCGFAIRFRLAVSWWLISAALCAVGNGQVCAEDAAAAAELPVAMMAIQQNAERLRSGEYSARGEVRVREWELAEDYTRQNVRDYVFEDEIDAAFDFDADRSLFRRRRVRIGGPPDMNRDLEWYRWELDTPGESVVLRGTENGRSVIRYPRGRWTDFYPHQTNNVEGNFDPRMLGWAGWDSIHVQFDEMFRLLTQSGKLISRDAGNGIVEIALTQQVDEDSSHVITLSCDEKQGWQPVRCTFHYVHTGRRARTVDPYDVTEITWEEHSDVWVVTSLSMSLQRGDAEKNATLLFHWQSVNGAVPDERFDWRKWRNPEDYQALVDARLGEKLDVTDRRRPPYEVPLPKSIQAPPQASANTRQWLLIGNLIVVAGVGGALTRRAVTKRRDVQGTQRQDDPAHTPG